VADAPLGAELLWFHARPPSSDVCRPRGWRATSWISERGLDPFWMRLSADLGDTPVKSLLTTLAEDAQQLGDWLHALWTRMDLAV
jgi:hypothetical protein